MVSFNLTVGAMGPHSLARLDSEDDLDGVYMDGSIDDYYRSSSGIYINSQDHILRIQRRYPDGCSVFHSELISIDEVLGSLASLTNGKEIWILSEIVEV
ncbi:uncharacterized protein TNCV_4504191 [Trichonephila clavipes]|nr:uncharacterized protein TNCV_4504191 [Trichonephila clavipes]